MKEITRKSNVELLRIVAMLMIITHHVIVHGLGLREMMTKSFHFTEYSYLEMFVNSFVVVGVNVFIFISGFFGIKFKPKSILSLVLQVFFYSVILYFVFIVFGTEKWNPKQFFYALQPVSKNQWWFFTNYILLYFLAPFLNYGMEKIPKKQILIMLIAFLYFDCYTGIIHKSIGQNGYTLFHFITLYLCARYVSIYLMFERDAEIRHRFQKFIFFLRRNSLGFYIAASLLVFLSAYFVSRISASREVWRVFSYNNPILILSSVFLFFTFYNLKIQKKWINWLAMGVLGVYLIHDHPLVEIQLAGFIQWMKVSIVTPWMFVVGISLTVLAVFLAGSLVDIGRKKVFESVERVFSINYKSSTRIIVKE